MLGLMSGREGGKSLGLMSGKGSTLPRDLSHDACDVPTPSPSRMYRQTSMKTLPSRNFICGRYIIPIKVSTSLERFKV